jgi:hypothetical protein
VGVVLGAGLGLLALAGCQRTMRWSNLSLPEAQRRAQASQQLTFVYFRTWYSVECTDFEENLLRRPDVLAETRGMINVRLDFDWDHALAQRWELDRAPAYAILAPNGQVLARDQAPIEHKTLLAAIRGAKAMLAAGHTGAPPAAR